MDIFDRINGVLDDLGISKENPIEDMEHKIESAKKAARFLNLITNPEEREKAIFEGLKQAYAEGVKSRP